MIRKENVWFCVVLEEPKAPARGWEPWQLCSALPGVPAMTQKLWKTNPRQVHHLTGAVSLCSSRGPHRPQRSGSADSGSVGTVLLKALGLFLREQCREIRAGVMSSFLLFTSWINGQNDGVCHPSHPACEGIPGNEMTGSQSFQNSRVQGGSTAEALLGSVWKRERAPQRAKGALLVSCQIH